MKSSIVVSAVVIASFLVASGCAEGSDSAVAEKVQATAKQQPAAITYKRVEFDTDAGPFFFDPSSCSIHQEDGSPAYSIHGRGLAPDKRLVFVTMEGEDGDPSTGLDMRIHVGVGEPFKHGDPVWISNDQQSLSLKVPASQTGIEGDVVTANGVVFGKDQEGQLVVTSPIRVDCGR